MDPDEIKEAERIRERKKQIAADRKRISTLENDSSMRPLAPVISTPGPDPHVIAGRNERTFRKAAKVSEVADIQSASGMRPTVNQGMADADIERERRSATGTTFKPQTSRIDDFKSRNGITAPSSASSRPSMQEAVSKAGDAFRSERAKATKAPLPGEKTTASQRAFSIAKDLRPGESIGIKAGTEAAMGWQDEKGVVRTVANNIPAGQKFSKRPAMVKNDAGKLVNMGEETARIAKPFNDARDRADKSATLTARVMQKNMDSDPNVMAGRRAKENMARRSQEYASNRAAERDAFQVRQARKSPTYSPSRRQVEQNNRSVASGDAVQRKTADAFRTNTRRRQARI